MRIMLCEMLRECSRTEKTNYDVTYSLDETEKYSIKYLLFNWTLSFHKFTSLLIFSFIANDLIQLGQLFSLIKAGENFKNLVLDLRNLYRSR